MTIEFAGILCVSVFYLIWGVHAPTGLIRSIVKTIPLIGLTIIALSYGVTWEFCAALAFSAIGDAALSRDGKRAFLIGLTSFLIAHILFVFAFISWGVSSPDSVSQYIILALIGVFAVVFGAYMIRHAAPLKAPVAIYILSISVMTTAVILMPDRTIILLAGAALFVVSDSLLGYEKFINPNSRITSYLIWSTYIGAQICLTLGALRHGIP